MIYYYEVSTSGLLRHVEARSDEDALDQIRKVLGGVGTDLGALLIVYTEEAKDAFRTVWIKPE